jgi:PAS domain S-box-containing protein
MGYKIKTIGNNNGALNELEEALRKSREEYRVLIEETPDLITRVDLEGRFLFVNQSAVTILGLAPEKCLGRVAFDYVSPEDREKTKAAFQVWLKSDAPVFAHENRIVGTDGQTHYMTWTIRPERDTFGNVIGFASTARDITERKKSEEELQKKKKLFHDFFESNPVATIITSPSGVIHMMNPAFSEASGFSVEEAVGRTTIELGFWNDPTDRENARIKIMEKGSINNLEVLYHAKSGQQLTWLLSSRLIDYDCEKRFLSTIQDVTAQRNAEEALRNLEQAKSNFIRIAAHELQTPLIAVLGYAELLENTDPIHINEEQKRYASIIRSNAEILSRLVNDLLDVERMQLGYHLSLVRENVSFADLIKNVVTSIKLKCPKHRFILAHTNSLPKTISADEDRISQVLNNLLINAVKYSPEGGIVEVSTTTDENSVSIAIRDYGLGMTPEQVAQIFDMFYRANPRNPLIGGLGLGMGIVKQIVEDHGGDLSISSNPGKGTTVTFTLPLESVDSL